MDWQTLKHAMGAAVSDERYQQLAPLVNDALAQADCTTVERAAMWVSQIGHESAGLKRFRELYDGDKTEYFTRMYENHPGLGNTQPGDGARFYGRGAIQVTGRWNYTKLSEWAHSNGLVPTATFFVDAPHELESDRYAFVGATWYWTVARDINSYADSRDIIGATRAINGGTNGLPDRTVRWNNCLAIGEALLPTTGGVVSAEEQVKTELVGPGFEGWEILGRSKIDARRFNTLVEAIAEIRDALVKPRQSFVDGSTVKFDLGTFVQCTDAATFRTERDVAALRAEVKDLTAAVKALAAKVGN